MSDPVPSFRVVVLSGPSGSGKSTIVGHVLTRSAVPIAESVSATTRPKRPGEVDGEDYHFLSVEEFNRLRSENAFLEFAEVHGAGYWYGTLRSEVDRIREAGRWALLEIDVEGAVSVMAAYPEAITIFLRTPSDEEFERRLRARGTESEADIRRRLENARNELQFADKYRFQVVNDDLDAAVTEICGLIESQATSAP